MSNQYFYFKNFNSATAIEIIFCHTHLIKYYCFPFSDKKSSLGIEFTLDGPKQNAINTSDDNDQVQKAKQGQANEENEEASIGPTRTASPSNSPSTNRWSTSCQHDLRSVRQIVWLLGHQRDELEQQYTILINDWTDVCRRRAGGIICGC